MPTIEVTQCQACRAAISFRRTPKGKLCPYDVLLEVRCDACQAQGAAEDLGTLCHASQACGGHYRRRFVETETSHFRTCIDPKRFSRKAGRAA